MLMIYKDCAKGHIVTICHLKTLKTRLVYLAFGVYDTDRWGNRKLPHLISYSPLTLYFPHFLLSQPRKGWS